MADCFAQQNISTVDNIRKAVEKINSDTSYTTKTLDNEEFMKQMTDGGGQLTGYFKNGQLWKIIARIGLSSCVNTTEYYVQDDKLYFVYIEGKEFKYVDSLASFDPNIHNVTMECRFYYVNGKMIKSILTGSTRCGGEPSDSWAKTYQDACSKYVTLLLSNK